VSAGAATCGAAATAPGCGAAAAATGIKAPVSLMGWACGTGLAAVPSATAAAACVVAVAWRMCVDGLASGDAFLGAGACVDDIIGCAGVVGAGAAGASGSGGTAAAALAVLAGDGARGAGVRLAGATICAAAFWLTASWLSGAAGCRTAGAVLAAPPRAEAISVLCSASGRTVVGVEGLPKTVVPGATFAASAGVAVSKPGDNAPVTVAAKLTAGCACIPASVAANGRSPGVGRLAGWPVADKGTTGGSISDRVCMTCWRRQAACRGMRGASAPRNHICAAGFACAKLPVRPNHPCSKRCGARDAAAYASGTVRALGLTERHGLAERRVPRSPWVGT
jgi:hypothetical protein